MKTTSGQKNLHEDDSVVSLALDKDVIIVDDEEKKAVDQPEKGDYPNSHHHHFWINQLEDHSPKACLGKTSRG